MRNRKNCRQLCAVLAACVMISGGCARYAAENGSQEMTADETAGQTAETDPADFFEELTDFSDFSRTFAEKLKEEQTVPEHASLAYFQQRNVSAKKLLQMLGRFDTAGMNANELLTCKLIEDRLQTVLLTDGMELYLQPLSIEYGLQTRIPNELEAYSFRTEADIEAYLGLMERMTPLFEEILAFEREKAKAGLITGGEPLDLVIQSLDPYMVRPDNLTLTANFLEKLEQIPELSDEQKKEYADRHLTALKEHFIPAYRTLSDGLTELREEETDVRGLADMPEGRRYFSYLIHARSGTGISVPELAAQIDQRIKADLDLMTLLTDQNPELSAQMQNYSFAFADTDSGISWLRETTAEDFPKVMSSEAQANPENIPLPQLAAEVWPGISYRSQYYEEHGIDPTVLALADRSSASAWSMYCERYAYRDGNGLSPELNQFLLAYTDASAGLYARMDLHLNYDGWSREQFDSYCKSYGFSDTEVMDQLYHEILADPGVRAAQYAGYLALIRLEQEAGTRLGDSFSPLEFHQFILDIGPVPYRLLEPYFRAWMLTANR